jgi:DNA-binding IscR family transcriptional regulator
LRRAPAEIHLSEVIRLVDGPLAPFGDAESLRRLIESDSAHRSLYQVFLQVRDAAAKILETTTLADIALPVAEKTKSRKGGKTKKEKDDRGSAE